MASITSDEIKEAVIRFLYQQERTMLALESLAGFDEENADALSLLPLLERIAIALGATTVTGAAPETLQPPTPAAPSAPDTPGAVPSFTYDEVVEAINGYADTHGHKAAKDLLTSFNVTYIKQLKPEQYPDVMKAFA